MKKMCFPQLCLRNCLFLAFAEQAKCANIKVAVEPDVQKKLVGDVVCDDVAVVVWDEDSDVVGVEVSVIVAVVVVVGVEVPEVVCDVVREDVTVVVVVGVLVWF